MRFEFKEIRKKFKEIKGFLEPERHNAKKRTCLEQVAKIRPSVEAVAEFFSFMPALLKAEMKNWQLFS